MISAGLRSLDIPFLDGIMFRQVTISWTSDIVINILNYFYGMEWQPNLTCSLTVCIYCSMCLMCSFDAHVFRCADDKKIRMW